MNVFKKCLSLLSILNESKSKIKNVSKLLYIGYIRVFIFKFEEYLRDNFDKLNNPKEIINSINSFENPFSSIIELYYYKTIYNKNDKNINIFSSKKNKYKIELLNNYKDFFSSQKNDNDSDDENDEKENSFINLLEEKVYKLKNSKEDYPFYEYFYYSDYIDEKYLTSINKYEKYPVLYKYLELENNGNILNDFYAYNMALNSLNEEYSSKITREKAKKEKLEEQLIYKENKDLFAKFFDIYKKYSSENDNDNDSFDYDKENNIKININLNEKLPLFNFFIVDENEFSEKYKYIYKQFIDKHNEIVGNLLEIKSKDFNNNNNENDNKINIQDITKENEIFVTKNDFSVQIALFNNSYRKVILNDDYSKFNEYEINLEYIEEMMTDKLLKNKKLINDEIFELKYKNEDLEFENKDICTKFKKTFNLEDLSINDKILFYEYFEENKGNVKLHLNLLDEFAYLIKYSTENIDKIKEPSQTKIDKYLEEIEYISKDFKEIFKDKKNLTLTKLLNIYEYYQILCFNKVKEELKQYQEKITDKEQKNLIENYVKIDLQKNEKIKNNLEVALRKFILCFLAKEKKREDKNKRNKNNIKN